MTKDQKMEALAEAAAEVIRHMIDQGATHRTACAAMLGALAAMACDGLGLDVDWVMEAATKAAKATQAVMRMTGEGKDG